MYLEGQLPGGPPSENRGGQPTTDAISALFGEFVPVGVNRKAGANPLDQLKETFWVTPEGGPVVVSPSLATGNGIVQYPVNNPTPYAPQTPIPPPYSGVERNPPIEPMTPYPPDARLRLPPFNVSVSPECGMAGLDISQLISPSSDSQSYVGRPVAPPNFVEAPRKAKGCPGYANDGSLISLRNDAFRNGLAGCCQSGYQGYQDYVLPQDDTGPWALLLAAGALMLLSSSPERKGRRG